MTNKFSARTLLLSGLTLGLGLSMPSAAFAAAETRFSVLVSGGIGYARNPFITGSGGGGGSAYVDGGINPRLDILTSRSTLSLTGSYNRQQYFSDYGGTDSYGAGLSYSNSLSSRLRVRGSLNFDSSISGQDYGVVGGIVTVPSTGLGSDVDVTLPGGGTIGSGLPIIDGIGDDLLLLGLRQRRNALSGSLGADYSFDEYNSIYVSGNASRVRYPGSIIGVNDFDTYGGSIGYNRRLSSRSSVGAQASISRVKYKDIAFGNSTIISPQLTYQTQFSDRLSLNAAAGVSINKRDVPGGTDSSVSPSASLSLCNTDTRQTLCLTAARSATANGISGVQNETSIALSYTRKLTERTSLNGQASYSRTADGDSSINPGFRRRAQFYGVSGGLDHQLSQRLRAGANAFYRDTSEPNFNRPADIGGRLFVSYTFGDL